MDLSDNVSSLTSPSDRGDKKYNINRTAEPLTSQQTQLALSELSISFPKIERLFADPTYLEQIYCLHSFIPSKGATPDKDGIYGMVKCRGCFPNLEMANDRASWIIRNIDSYHNIYTGYVGRPFPISVNPKYSSEVNEIDIRKKISDTVSEDVKSKRDEERKTMEEIKEREEKLKEDVSKEQPPDDVYTTLRVKKAQLIWTFQETHKKLDEMKSVLRKTQKEIEAMDNESPTYKKIYYDKYMNARKESGIPMDDTSFIKYLGEDVDIEKFIN